MEKKNAFTDIPRTVKGHFRIEFYAAVYRVLDYIRRQDRAGGEGLTAMLKRHSFLAGYFEEINPYLPGDVTWEAALAWWQNETAAWRQAGEGHLPLQALMHQGDLDYRNINTLMVVGLVEEDSRFGTLFAGMQGPLTYRRPCLQTVEQVMADETGLPDSGICRPLLSAGLLEVLNKDTPRSEWIVRVPTVLWDVIRGHIEDNPVQGYEYLPSGSFPQLEACIVPSDFLGRLWEVPALMQRGKAGAVVLRGSPGSERLRLAGALARAMDRNIIAVEIKTTVTQNQVVTELLGPLCTMTRSIPLFQCDAAPGETVEIPRLKGYNGYCFVLTGLEGGLRGKVVEEAVTLTIPALEAVYRKRCWQEALPGQEEKNLEQIAGRFHLPGQYIRLAASLASAHAALERRTEVRIADVLRACRQMNRQLLDTLAAPLESGGSWDRLVVNTLTAEKLRELERRCRCREKILDNLGPAFGSAKNTGVRALFSGASGTGKTLAAQILAAELEMDIYRVDLAAVVNKYIGETEKNLHRVLTRAEELDVILLLDEGDALLGSRTEVKTANDRYANLETDYLLQKLENYRGIVFITTNAVENIDSAFQRRMDIVVGFVPPQAQERWHIWQLHLPQDHALTDVFLEDVAVRCEMTGGQIRNAALHSALLALDDNGTVSAYHLEKAVQSEYRKAGALCPLNGKSRKKKGHGGIDAFWGALSS